MSATVPVDDLIITPQLGERPPRPARYEEENRALVKLAQLMARQPEALFQQLVEVAMDLCGADSAGISLIDEEHGQPVFRWRATAGLLASWRGTTLPRYSSPCGAVVDRNQLLLLTRPAQAFPYIQALPVVVEEALLVPFQDRAGTAIGTIWLVAHDTRKRFDAEDARLAGSLSQFASAAWQAVSAQAQFATATATLQERERENLQAQNALADSERRFLLSEARFYAFFDQAPFYAGILATDGRLLEAAQLSLVACGYTREQVVNRPFWETAWWRSSPAAQQQIRDGFEAALRGETVRHVLPYCFADGSEHFAALSLSPVFDAQQEIRYVIVAGLDVTERFQAEQELASARRRLETAVLAAELGIYEWDVVHNRIYGDANFMRLFGTRADEARGAPLDTYLQVLHPEDRLRTRELIEHSVRTGENFEADYRIVVDGRERWINSRGRMNVDAGGRVVSFHGVAIDITKRKQAEQEREVMAAELRRLAAVHETVLSATNDFAYIFDRQGRFLYANRELLRVWGRTLDQIVGRTCYDLGYPEWHADMHMREIAQVIATKAPIRGEVPFTGGSGISGIYDYIFSPVLGADGEVELIAGTTRDVTTRRRTEDRDRFLVTLDDATRPLTDPAEITQTCARLLGEHLLVNRCAYADVEEDENTFNLTGDYNRGVPSIVGRYRFDAFGEECLRLMRAGESYVVEEARQDPRTAGVRESYEQTLIRAVVCVPLRKAGRFVAAMAVHQNEPRVWLASEVELVQLVANRCWESIERARVMRVLAASEQQLRLAVDTARLGVWEVDLRTEVLTCSAQFKLSHAQPSDRPLTYAEFWSCLDAPDRERVRTAMAEAVATNTEYELEYRAGAPGGLARWVLARGHALYASDGTPLRLLGVSLDITSRKEAEREITRLHEEAVRASRAKDDFLATLSHELRTPLNPVLLLASEAALDPALPDPARQAFEVIRRNVELEARLIDDLLDLTTIVRGKVTVRRQQVDVHEALREAMSALQGEFAAKRISIEHQLEAKRCTLWGDSDRLVQVFVNLLRNAAKFTPEGGAAQVRTAVEADGRLVIEIADTGYGMTAAELGRVFGAFEQGEHATTPSPRRFGGLGLGLAIARQLVELHSGTIEAHSPGRDLGSVFRVRLPLPAMNAAAQPRHLPPVERSSPRRHRELRILLVEDHDPTRETLVQLLRRRGHSVEPVASLKEARAAARRGTFDLVVSDIGLPDGDGTTLMAELRENYGLRGIALTGYGMTQDVERSYASGFSAHLTKPVRIEAFDTALEAFVAAGAA